MPTRVQWLRSIDTEQIEQAIARAEVHTSGEIRVSVAPFFVGDVQRTAEQAFARLGMSGTRERNGVLFFVVPARKKFAIVGDEGVHARVGQAFWDELRGVMSAAFHDGHATEGLVAAIERVGERLAEHFPATASDNPDELANRVDFANA
jgi:uncharacterized membrane protein